GTQGSAAGDSASRLERERAAQRPALAGADAPAGDGAVGLGRDRGELVAHADVADVQLDLPGELLELAAVADPAVDVQLVVRVVRVRHVRCRTKDWVVDDREADRLLVLPAQAEADVEALEHAVVERVVRREVPAPFG